MRLRAFRHSGRGGVRSIQVYLRVTSLDLESEYRGGGSRRRALSRIPEGWVTGEQIAVELNVSKSAIHSFLYAESARLKPYRIRHPDRPTSLYLREALIVLRALKYVGRTREAAWQNARPPVPTDLPSFE